MRFRTTGQLRRLDLTPIVDLLPSLRDEWAGLRFDNAGQLINPLTGVTVAALSLVHGRHREIGAVYRITLTSPSFELSRGASTQVGIEESNRTATISRDDARRLEFTLADESERWTVLVEIEHARMPKVVLDGRIDLTAMVKDFGAPGCLARLLGGRGQGRFVLDAASFDAGGPMLEAKGSANRFRGDARLHLRTTGTQWEVEGDGSLRARGLGRLVLLVAGRRLRKYADREVAGLWESSDALTEDIDADLVRLQAAVDAEGGAVPFVRRALWDELYDAGF